MGSNPIKRGLKYSDGADRRNIPRLPNLNHTPPPSVLLRPHSFALNLRHGLPYCPGPTLGPSSPLHLCQTLHIRRDEARLPKRARFHPSRTSQCTPLSRW